MFFTLSKVLGVLVNPADLVLILLCLGGILLWTPWRRAGRRLATLTILAGLAMATLPMVSEWPLVVLENRFPAEPALPERVDGVITLGGIVDQYVSKARAQTSVGPGAERLTEFAALARRYPAARLVFTGGSGRLFSQELKEADYLRPLLDELGLAGRDVIFENQSRNTYENALFSKRLVNPAPDEVWVIVTSAAHTPRSIGAFREVGWNVIAKPVDYATTGEFDAALQFNFGRGMGHTHRWLHEWFGLFFYWITDRSSALFPEASP